MAALALALTLAACGGDGRVGPLPARDRVVVQMKDFAISAQAARPKAGKMTFLVMNEGPSGHVFSVIDTDLPEDKIPVTTDGKIASKGEGYVVSATSQILQKKGQERPFTIPDIKPGRYVLVCRYPGHYQKGMYTTVTVEQ